MAPTESELFEALNASVDGWLGRRPSAQPSKNKQNKNKSSNADAAQQAMVVKIANRYALDNLLLTGRLDATQIRLYTGGLFDNDSAAFASYAIGTAHAFASGAPRPESIDAARTANCPVVVASPDTEFSTIASVANKAVVRMQFDKASYYYTPEYGGIPNDPLNKWLHTAISNILKANDDKYDRTKHAAAEWVEKTFGIHSADFKNQDDMSNTLLCRYKSSVYIANISGLISGEGESVDKIQSRQEAGVKAQLGTTVPTTDPTVRPGTTVEPGPTVPPARVWVINGAGLPLEKNPNHG